MPVAGWPLGILSGQDRVPALNLHFHEGDRKQITQGLVWAEVKSCKERKEGKGITAAGVGEGVRFEKMGEIGLSEEMAPEQKLEGWEGRGTF